MSTTEPQGLQGRVVAVAGAGGPAGHATVLRLARAGAVVLAADADPVRLGQTVADADALAPGKVTGEIVDLLDPEATGRWASGAENVHGHVDGLVHLVGGWRGGKTFADTSLDDWALLHDLLIRTVQLTSLAFHDPLTRSDAGRFVLVSATAAAHPTAGNAAYAAAKAAAEAWTLALADSFSKSDGDAAAVVFTVKALVHEAMRAQRPEAAFAGFTDVTDLADAIASVWGRPTEELNGKRLCLTQD